MNIVTRGMVTGGLSFPPREGAGPYRTIPIIASAIPLRSAHAITNAARFRTPHNTPLIRRTRSREGSPAPRSGRQHQSSAGLFPSQVVARRSRGSAFHSRSSARAGQLADGPGSGEPRSIFAVKVSTANVSIIRHPPICELNNGDHSCFSVICGGDDA